MEKISAIYHKYLFITALVKALLEAIKPQRKVFCPDASSVCTSFTIPVQSRVWETWS